MTGNTVFPLPDPKDPIEVRDPGGVRAQQINDVCVSGSGCGRALDFRAKAWKFDTDTLHIRSFPEKALIVYHWDRFNIRLNFWMHVWVDIIKNVRYGGLKGL